MSGAGLFMLCAVLMLLNTVLFAYVAQGYIHPEKSMNTDAGQNKYEAPAAENQNSITPISTTSLTDGNSSGIADTL